LAGADDVEEAGAAVAEPDHPQLIIVYIAEAHAGDEWPINSRRCGGPGNDMPKHTTQADRALAARAMLRALPCLEGIPLLCDGMADGFQREYAAWPIRLYGIQGGRLQRIAQPRGACFDLAPMREWLLGIEGEDAGRLGYRRLAGYV
jgi:hypothetical protein